MNPPFITFTSFKEPFSTIGVNFAPLPNPLTIRSGGEVYSVPPFVTKTSTILPFEIIGITLASFPELKLNSGYLL